MIYSLFSGQLSAKGQKICQTSYQTFVRCFQLLKLNHFSEG